MNGAHFTRPAPVRELVWPEWWPDWTYHPTYPHRELHHRKPPAKVMRAFLDSLNQTPTDHLRTWPKYVVVVHTPGWGGGAHWGMFSNRDETGRATGTHPT